jgi:hypothetical protein
MRKDGNVNGSQLTPENGGGKGFGYGAAGINRMAVSPNGHNCQDTPDYVWNDREFPDKCYFYPARDCPRMERGTICARISRRIPTITEELDEWQR